MIKAGFCVKCKCRRGVNNISTLSLKSAKVVERGRCRVCATTVFNVLKVR